MSDIASMYQHSNKSIIQHVNHENTIKCQLPLSRKRKGLGLRNPKNHYLATKMSLPGKLEQINQFFLDLTLLIISWIINQ